MLAYNNMQTSTGTAPFNVFESETSTGQLYPCGSFYAPPYDDIVEDASSPIHDIRTFDFIRGQVIKYYRSAVFNYDDRNVLKQHSGYHKNLDSRSGYKGLKRLKRERG
jgi:hypothetical protein